MPKQWQGGCVNCGEPRWTVEELSQGIDLAGRNVHIIRDGGQRTIVGMCKDCFAMNCDSYDLDKIKANLYASELECLKARVKSPEEYTRRLPLVEGIKALVFIGAQKP